MHTLTVMLVCVSVMWSCECRTKAERDRKKKVIEITPIKVDPTSKTLAYILAQASVAEELAKVFPSLQPVAVDSEDRDHLWEDLFSAAHSAGSGDLAWGRLADLAPDDDEVALAPDLYLPREPSPRADRGFWLSQHDLDYLSALHDRQATSGGGDHLGLLDRLFEQKGGRGVHAGNDGHGDMRAGNHDVNAGHDRVSDAVAGQHAINEGYSDVNAEHDVSAGHGDGITKNIEVKVGLGGVHRGNNGVTRVQGVTSHIGHHRAKGGDGHVNVERDDGDAMRTHDVPVRIQPNYETDYGRLSSGNVFEDDHLGTSNIINRHDQPNVGHLSGHGRLDPGHFIRHSQLDSGDFNTITMTPNEISDSSETDSESESVDSESDDSESSDSESSDSESESLSSVEARLPHPVDSLDEQDDILDLLLESLYPSHDWIPSSINGDRSVQAMSTDDRGDPHDRLLQSTFDLVAPPPVPHHLVGAHSTDSTAPVADELSRDGDQQLNINSTSSEGDASLDSRQTAEPLDVSVDILHRVDSEGEYGSHGNEGPDTTGSHETTDAILRIVDGSIDSVPVGSHSELDPVTTGLPPSVDIVSTDPHPPVDVAIVQPNGADMGDSQIPSDRIDPAHVGSVHRVGADAAGSDERIPEAFGSHEALHSTAGATDPVVVDRSSVSTAAREHPGAEPCSLGSLVRGAQALLACRPLVSLLDSSSSEEPVAMATSHPHKYYKLSFVFNK